MKPDKAVTDRELGKRLWDGLEVMAGLAAEQQPAAGVWFPKLISSLPITARLQSGR